MQRNVIMGLTPSNSGTFADDNAGIKSAQVRVGINPDKTGYAMLVQLLSLNVMSAAALVIFFCTRWFHGLVQNQV